MLKFIKTVITVGAYATKGYVLQAWWYWFLVPKGLPPLTYVEATLLGAALFLFTRPHYDTMQVPANIEKRIEWAMINTFLVPATLYALGLCIKTYLTGA